MTKVEMEDVLSSIRRLVADGSSAEESDSNVISDRFVLTPAFRVPAGDVDPAHEPSLGDAPGNDAPEDSRPIPENSEDLQDADGAAPDASLFSSRRSASESIARTISEKPGEAPKDPAREPGATPVNDPSAEDFDDPFEAAHEFHGSLETRIAELEIAVSRTEGDWEPDGSEPEIAQMPDRRIFEVVENKRFSETSKGAEETTPAAEEDREAPLQLADVAYFTHTPPEALEMRRARAELAQADKPFEQDRPRAPQELPHSQAMGEVVEGDDDIFIEEEALRQIVSEIVRQELQGRLGERITKNVRRMVRREIEKAMSLKSLD